MSLPEDQACVVSLVDQALMSWHRKMMLNGPSELLRPRAEKWRLLIWNIRILSGDMKNIMWFYSTYVYIIYIYTVDNICNIYISLSVYIIDNYIHCCRIRSYIYKYGILWCYDWVRNRSSTGTPSRLRVVSRWTRALNWKALHPWASRTGRAWEWGLEVGELLTYHLVIEHMEIPL